jgi:hypothetical protein
MIRKERVVWSVLIVLLAFVSIFGIFPALTRIQTDFPNYYTAGVIARTGIGVERLYDDHWFQQQISAQGISELGKFSPFPPATALLFIPLSWLTPLTALRILTLINILLLAGTVRLLAKLFSVSARESCVFVLLSGLAVVNCFRFGQLYIALMFTMVLTYSWLTKRRTLPAGLAAGILLPVKYFPVVLLLFFLLKREWKAALATLATSGLLLCLSVAVLGWRIHEEWLLTVVGQHLQSHLTQQNPFSMNFQSFDSLCRRLFVFDAALNPSPMLDAPMLYPTTKYLSVAVVLAATASVVGRMATRHAVSGNAFALLSVAALLVAPATATYHFLLLCLPVGILLAGFHTDGYARLFWLTLGAYCAIGFLPYKFFAQFDGHSALTLLAYPRLWLLTILFILSFRTAAREMNSSALLSVR